MLRFLQAGKLLVYFAACCFGGYRGISEIRIALTESKPTSFTAANFPRQHRDEQWVEVIGRVAVEHQNVQPSPYRVHDGKNLVYVMVPIVGEDWEPEKPVHVLATFGPMPALSVAPWLLSIGRVPKPVQGQLRPGGVRDPQAMFPNLLISKSYVIINEGTKPKHAFAMAGFLSLMVVSGWLFASQIYSIVKDSPE
jgi:hypothetical protein